MASFCVLFFVGFLFSVAAARQSDTPQSDNALRCKDHPAYDQGLKPVLISSWDYDVSSPEFQQFVYLPRYSKHVYAPVGDPSSNKYNGLDLFYIGESLRPSFRMTFQRPALVYLLVSVESSNFSPAADVTLLGWRSEGWVERVDGDNTITYGIHGPVSGKMPQYAYVFSKPTATNEDFVEIPQGQFVKTTTVGIPVNGGFNILVAEADGSPSPPVGTFQGEPIPANEKCPDKLHAVWMTEDDNNDDIDTRGVKFETWHPAWDPCFWCAYDHEHGSNPRKIMGYTPKFTYTSRKNNRQMETQRGFKGFVLRTDPYYVYYSLHVVQSSLNRVTIRFHTINFAVVDRNTKELLMDIQHKGDFGWTGVRLFDKKTFEPIDSTQQNIQVAQLSGPNNFRSINVLENPNNRFDTSRDPPELGQYEEWQTLPMCMEMQNRDSLLEVIFKTPNTGIKSLTRQNDLVRLGRPGKSELRQSSGLNRSLRFNNLQFGAEFCPDSGANGGYFYTDANGTEIRSGPGPTSVRQFVKPGFKGTLDGRYEVVDIWSGLYEKDVRGFFTDHGYGIDPTWN